MYNPKLTDEKLLYNKNARIRLLNFQFTPNPENGCCSIAHYVKCVKEILGTEVHMCKLTHFPIGVPI